MAYVDDGHKCGKNRQEETRSCRRKSRFSSTNLYLETTRGRNRDLMTILSKFQVGGGGNTIEGILTLGCRDNVYSGCGGGGGGCAILKRVLCCVHDNQIIYK